MGARVDSIRPLTVIGLMSGTSVDGVDACAVRLGMVAGRLDYAILATHREPMPEPLRVRLLKVMQDQSVGLEELCALQVEVGALFARTAQALMQAQGWSASDVAAIGSHGQTLYHWPPQTGEVLGWTLQIGEPSIIAERTGVRTVADFRTRDMAAGGQGAPLVSFADVLLFQDEHEGRAVQNIGGIANVTVIPDRRAHREADIPVIAFDTGPGNMLMDGAMTRFYGRPYDADGAIAASGTVSETLLAELMAHPYLSEAPPKTTGREAFGLPFLESLLASYPALPPADWVATLTRFTADSIVQAYEQFVFPHTDIRTIILGGGGVCNRTLMQWIAEGFAARGRSIALKTHADFGIPDQYKEALAFAVLAWASLLQRPNNIPTCTGAQHPVIMGKHVF